MKKAILREGGQKFVLNAGYPPQLGKYNESACLSCYRHYSLRDATIKRWRCSCGKTIKRGVFDRVDELADLDKPIHPDHRPPYINFLPLSKIIARSLGVKSETSKKVTAHWNSLVSHFGNEIDLLLYGERGKIEELSDSRIARAVLLFRSGKIPLIPGGGGQYGDIDLSDMELDVDEGEGKADLFSFDPEKKNSGAPEKKTEKEEKTKQTTLF